MTHKRNALKNARREAQRLSDELGKPFEVHHRHPRSRKDSYEGRHIDEVENLEIMEVMMHRAFHTIFQNRTAEEVAALLTDKYISHNYYFVAVPRKRKPIKGRRQRRFCTDCDCEVLKHIPKKE